MEISMIKHVDSKVRINKLETFKDIKVCTFVPVLTEKKIFYCPLLISSFTTIWSLDYIRKQYIEYNVML